MDQIIEFVMNHWMLASAWAVLVTVLLISFNSGSTKAIGNQQVTTLLNREKAVVVDIRTKKDFSKGHLLGSVNIPLASIKDSQKELEKYQNHPIILVDANGLQTSSAAQQIKKMGIENLSRMQGGIQSWTNDNLPLSKP